MPTIVTPAAYDNPCTEMWVDPSTLSALDPTLAEQASVSATWALWSLSGERFHGAQCWVEDYRTIRGYCTIQLRKWPVTEISYVSRVDLCSDAVAATGIGDVITGWCDQGSGQLRVCCAQSSAYSTGCSCPATGAVVRVHYKIGNNLPPGADRVAARLAEEYVNAAEGRPCSLPERITSITRQGASWTILDPLDFLEDGLTGIGSVDSWLSQAGTRNRWASLIDPLRSVPLASSTLVGCGDDDCFADISP